MLHARVLSHVYIYAHMCQHQSCLAIHAIYTRLADLLEDCPRVGLIHQPTLAK